MFPNPDSDVFASWIFQSGHLVKIKVVELFPDRLEDCFDVSIVHDPAELWVARAVDRDFDFETVAVEAAAFV